MEKLVRHIRKWAEWKKYNLNSAIYKVLVLFGIVHSPTFEFFIPSYMWKQELKYDQKEIYQETDG